MSIRKPTPPAHLRAATQKWWSQVVADFELEPHHLRLLTLAGEAWDRTQQAREALKRHGVTFADRFGQPRGRPEVTIERDSRLAYLKVMRELALDVSEPVGDSRPPRLPGTAGRKGR